MTHNRRPRGWTLVETVAACFALAALFSVSAMTLARLRGLVEVERQATETQRQLLRLAETFRADCRNAAKATAPAPRKLQLALADGTQAEWSIEPHGLFRTSASGRDRFLLGKGCSGEFVLECPGGAGSLARLTVRVPPETVTIVAGLPTVPPSEDAP